MDSKTEIMNVDLVVEPLPYTKEDRSEISALISEYKKTGEVSKPILDSIRENTDELLIRINRTIELIRVYDNGIKQAKGQEAPVYLIESKERKKSQLVNELMDLLAEMDVQFELKIAA
jgi:hypothetical protein